MSEECGDVYVLTDNPDLPEPVNCKREPDHDGWHRHSFQTSVSGSTVWFIEWNDAGEHRYGKVSP